MKRLQISWIIETVVDLAIIAFGYYTNYGISRAAMIVGIVLLVINFILYPIYIKRAEETEGIIKMLTILFKNNKEEK